MLVENMNQVLLPAKRGKYAVQFNAVNLNWPVEIVATAEASRPGNHGNSRSTLPYTRGGGFLYLIPIAKKAMYGGDPS